MDWLFTHPEEPAAAGGAAAAATAAAATTGGGSATAAATEQVNEEEELSRALIASLSAIGISPERVQSSVRSPPPSTPPAAPLAAAAPATATADATQAAAAPVTTGGDAAMAAAEAVATSNEPPTSSAQPAGPSTSAAPATAATATPVIPGAVIPAPTQLVDGAVSLLATASSSSFAVAELLYTMTTREDGKDRKAVVQRLMDRFLIPDVPPAEALKQHGVQMLTAARLLVLLLHRDIPSREVVANLGFVSKCLDLLEVWQRQYAADLWPWKVPPGKWPDHIKTAEDREAVARLLDVPVWVEAALLLLDLLSGSIAKPPARAQDTGAAAAAAGGPGAAAGTATATAGTTTAAAEAAPAVATTRQPAGPGAAAGSHQAVATAADATATAGPSEAAGGDTPMVPSSDSEAGPSAVGAVAPAASQQLPLPPELAGLSGLTEALKTWRPCGLISDDEQSRAITFSMTLLRNLYDYADKWERPDTSMFEEDGSLPNPSAVTQAVLQLLAHLTKRHANALHVSWLEQVL